MLRELLEAAPDGIVGVGGDGRIVLVNTQTERLFGYARGELAGQPLELLVPDRLHRAHERHRDAYLADPRTRPMGAGVELYGRRRDGSEFPAEISLSSIDTEHGTLALAAIRDVTERRAEERARERAMSELREAQRIARIGSWSWDATTDTATWSDEMYRIFGRDRQSGAATSEEFLTYLHPADREPLASGYRQRFGGGPAFDLDYRIIRADGLELTLHALGREDPDRPGHYAGTVQDVTELRAVERALRDSQNQLRRHSEVLSGVIDNAPIGEALVAPDGIFLRVNRSLCEIVGYSETELLALTFQDITHPDDLETDLGLVRQVLAGEIRTYQLEKRYLHKAGHAVWIKLSASLVRDEHGEPLHFISQIEDITAAKQTEQALLASEARLQSIIEHAPAGISLRDLEGRYQLVNTYAAAAVGLTPLEMIGRSSAGHNPPEMVDAIRAQDERLIATGEPMTEELAVTHADGTLHAYHVVKYPVRDPDGTITGLGAFSLDITQRKLSEQRLRDRERQLAEAQALAHVGSWEWDLGQPRSFWSDELCRIFGQPPRFTPTYEEAMALVHPDDRDAVSGGVDAAKLAAGSESDYRIIRPDGEVRDVHARRFGRIDADGNVTHLFGTIQDITERKRAERELRQAREYSEAIITAMSEGYGLTVEGRMTAVNQALCELTGFSRDELIDATAPFPFWPPETIARLSGLRGQASCDQGGTFELTLMRKDGTRFEAEITAQPARNPDGSLIGFVNTVRDVSSRRRYEAELERLAARDPLTGLPNHRVFHERLREEVARATRHARALSVVILDLDHFKQINDQHGHLVGDTVLQEVAERLGGLVRDGELLARVGGEEFAWILPDAQGVGAFAAAERARHAINVPPIPPIGNLTLSAGVCDLAHAQEATELYERADQALYWAKHHGRDQTFRYSTQTARQLETIQAAEDEPARVQSLAELALTAEAKHPDFAEHARRVAELASRLATLAGWPRADARALYQAALLHDIGKIAVPDSIISKPGALNAAERAQMRTHPAVGAEMLTASLSPDQVSWVRYHHERWDGNGYPDRLTATAIPEGARLLAVADAYDAMTHHRPYRAALTPQRAILEIHAHAGTQFAPRAVELLDQALGQQVTDGATDSRSAPEQPAPQPRR